MTEIPALRDALVEAAARRARAPRTPRLVLALVPVAAVAAIAVVVFVLAGRPAPDRERPAATPAAPTFAVLERPKTAADAYPGHPEWDSRLVARNGLVRLWLVPEGARVCAIARRVDAVRRTCAVATPGGAAWGTVWRILPDDATDATVTLMDGRQLEPPVRHNAVLVAVPDDPAAVGWTRGRTRYVRQYATFYAPTLERCPRRLDRLPAGWRATAMRAALRAVDDLYNGVSRATVTSVVRPAGTPCHAAVTARSVAVSLHLVRADNRASASLSQGRLLLGVIGERMTVYELMH